MLSLLNPWILISVLSLVASSFFYGHHVAYVEQEAEVARLNLIERNKEQQMQQLVNTHARELERTNRDAKDKVTKLQSDIASGELRLSIATRPVQACSDSTSASGDSTSRAELDPEASKSLIAITADGDNAIRSLNACIQIYNQVRGKQ
jgi:Bacteriophage Rz lysis protein